MRKEFPCKETETKKNRAGAGPWCPCTGSRMGPQSLRAAVLEGAGEVTGKGGGGWFVFWHWPTLPAVECSLCAGDCLTWS